MSESTGIHLRQEAGWAQLTLDRPPLNILNFAMLDSLAAHLSSLGSVEDLKLISLRGTGRCFCAGVDVEPHLAPQYTRMLQSFHGVLRLLEELAVPTVALVHGHALGGGCELALACDFVYAEETASFGQPEIHLGVFAPAATVMLPRRVPWMRAAKVLLTGDTFTAIQFADWGLVELALPGNLDQALAALKGRLEIHSAASLRCAKHAMVAASRAAGAEALEVVERIYTEDLMRTQDAEEGLRSFLEKRKPIWKNQ